MQSLDITSNTQIDFNNKYNKEDPKFEIGYHVRISNYKKFFGKGYTSNWHEKGFMIKKVKNIFLRIYVVGDLSGEEIVGTIQKKELQKTNQKQSSVEKNNQEKKGKLYVKWKAMIVLLTVGFI